MENCVFCQIIEGQVPSHKFWEDDEYIAFLSIFPNTKGFTIVTTKKHYPSYAFDLDDNVLTNLVIASKKVARLLDSKLEDVERTGMIFEGFGVDHVHSKLFPMHGTTNMKKWRKLSSEVNKFFEKYEGYISSHDYKRADDKELAELAKKLRE
ncbi:diadenosine tetraphosphate hydrolase [Candidatus Curtissbacteria bacterium RIFCSPHIGHO2_01_FULL_41_11]|uniref:Diadenosine tetraphosphate hydrolase n=1 Tax=Candidatus Curtissbacteria bacterium RIFCSPHIGHO2_01_FULL_41_11 TaxID=1797711 RepID=A0A1F5G3Z2_9BACT|nr:MAG: diadenosine tetraphosphate hydrolase [Candidatus Curtissbacteria bacterium RIFCSPHIGHO2_01_FULL_41_11]